MIMHKRYAMLLVLACLAYRPALAVEQRHGILVGDVLKLDAAAKTVVVKAADGTEHTIHFLKRTAVHGAEGAATGAKDAFHGLKAGSQVAVHYTAKGTEESAREIDNIGKDGMKATDVTVVHVDRGARTLAVKTSDGAEETYRLTKNAARDAGKDVEEGADKSAKVTVYYTGEAGHKVAHFLKRAV
jgi:hypothetical protein